MLDSRVPQELTISWRKFGKIYINPRFAYRDLSMCKHLFVQLLLFFGIRHTVRYFACSVAPVWLGIVSRISVGLGKSLMIISVAFRRSPLNAWQVYTVGIIVYCHCHYWLGGIRASSLLSNSSCHGATVLFISLSLLWINTMHLEEMAARDGIVCIFCTDIVRLDSWAVRGCIHLHFQAGSFVWGMPATGICSWWMPLADPGHAFIRKGVLPLDGYLSHQVQPCVTVGSTQINHAFRQSKSTAQSSTRKVSPYLFVVFTVRCRLLTLLDLVYTLKTASSPALPRNIGNIINQELMDQMMKMRAVPTTPTRFKTVNTVSTKTLEMRIMQTPQQVSRAARARTGLGSIGCIRWHIEMQVCSNNKQATFARVVMVYHVR